jgi:hypothetical protein
VKGGSSDLKEIKRGIDFNFLPKGGALLSDVPANPAPVRIIPGGAQRWEGEPAVRLMQGDLL